MGYDPDEPSVGSVLLCRFLKMKPQFKGKGQHSKTFLIALQKHLKNEGLERRRVGGSSGFLEYNKELKILMSTPNAAPKCSKGVVYLRSKDNLRWHVFYCSQEGTWKYTYYTTPQPGGSFEMPPNYFEAYYFLQSQSSTMKQKKTKRKEQISCQMRRFRNVIVLKRNGSQMISTLP